jgi:hemicentin
MVPVFNETAFVVGGDAWLPCEATGIPPPKISWFRDSEEIDMLSTKYHIHANGTLQIKNLEQGDSGIYWCMATNEGGQHNHSITLDVHFGPLFNGYPFDFDLDGMVSSTIVLNCSTLSNPAAEVIWYKNDTQIQIASGSRFSVSSDGARLTISDLREGDAGNYTCRVKNYVNGISVSWPLTVVVPSSILKNINRVNALLNLSAWLPCYTYGIPTPRVKWVQDGWQIHDSSKYVTFGNGTLRIDNLQQSDSGVYECHAGNVGGNDTHNILLNVQYGPVLESTLEDKVVLAHSDVIFHCQASGNPLPLITWSRNGQTLNSSIARVRVFGSTLVVRDVRIYDNGSYTCTAKSTFVHLGVPIVRKASSTAKLTVNEPPIITHYEVLVTVSENETSWFDCKASGFPHPNIQWLKNDTEINDIFSNRPPDMESTDHESGFPPPNIPWLNDGQEIVGNGYQIFSNGTLRMDSLSKNDSGLYKCIATNIVGKDNITTRLDVLYPPFITNKFYDQSSIIDIYKSVTFQCIADGNPSPQLEWWFQGHRLNNSVQGISITSDSLTIDGVQSRNAGQYTCVAINLVGEHSRTLGLNIIERESDLIEVKINSDTYLPCVVHGEPSPQLTWWKDGVKLNLSEPRFDKFESGTLHIKGVLREDGGGYQCVVFNFGVSAIKNTTLSVLYPPNIISGPIDQTVFVQSNVTFNCIVDASLPYQITWTKNGRSIENQESLELGPIIDVEQSNVISISPDGSLLTISNIDRNASGWYTCFAQNEIGLTTASGHLNVIVGAVCLFQNNAVEHVRGTTASFPCGAYGLPKPVAVWEKNALSLSGQPRFSSNSDGLLTIRDIRKDDDGMYVCIARNPGGSASCATRMTVLVPPEITIALSDQRILWGLDATFICEAEGNPPPVLSWEKDGAEIVVNGSGSVEISADRNTLTVKHVSVGDAGLYTCNASNKVSHAESTGHLFIIVPPTVRVDEIVTYTEGDIAFMHCRPRGDPTPSVEWIINGNAVQNVDVRYQVLNEGTLKITNVTQSDAGIYECIATNEGGQVNASTTLQVKYKPVIIVPPDNVRVVEGETGSFRCVVQSWPSSNIVWLRERKTLKNATGAIEISSDGTLLSIVNVRPAEEGSYTCLATNEVGEVHTDAWLQVIVLPEIFPGPSPVLFTQNGPAWLPCHAEGRPPPTIQWLKDGVEISGEERYRVLSNGTLYITELHASDSGVFQCVASNYGGFVTMDIELDVQVPPDIIVFDGNVTVDTGYWADLKCISIGNPRPHVTWKFEGRPVDLTDPRFTLLNNGTLRIHDVKKDDLGSYTCEARNSVGITSIFSWLNVKYSPQIIRPSDNTDVVVNATAWLNCVAESNPPAVITWTVHGQSLPGSSRYTQLDNGTLEIRPDEEGLYVYECRATNPLGNDTITVVVTVLAHPQIVHPPDDHDYVVIEGLTLLLDCVALGYHQPQISWSRHGRPVDLTSSRFTVFPNGTLRIDRVSEKEDDGSYTCTATNRVGEDSQQFNVDVQTRPSVEPITPRTVNAGDVVYLECVVSGNPLPSVKWYFENTPVADLGNKRISTAKGNRLKIRKIKTAEAGKYDCVATNDLGSARGSIQVTVRTHPSIKKMKDASTYRGETIYLNCPAQGNPRPTITWLKDGQPVVLDYRQAFFPLNGTLKLINVQTTDTGNYTCRAENVVGAVEKKMALFVRVPVIISGLIDTVATAGQDVVLRCKATGVPKPRVAWFVHPSVRSSPRLQQMPDGSLRLRNAERSDSGMFTCRASNSPNDSPKDNDEKSAILTVVVPPTIGPVQDVTVMQGDVAVLPCPAQGTQPIRYTWIKHTSNRLPLGGRHGISQATGSLTITDAQASDAGSYECQAQNQVATARQSVRLFVQTLPHITPPRNDLLFPTPSAGQSIVLHCQVGGSPQPDVIWTKDGVNIEGGQRFVIGRDNSLTIRNLRSDDAGRYVCTAVNAVGNATLNYTLTVLFSPVIVTGPQSQTVTSGETVTFLCVVYAQPQATIVWRKDGLALSSVGVTTYPSGRLVIHSAKKADAGSYTCTASNTLGLATSQAASLIVRYPPTITVPPGNQSVLHGAPVSLRCLASEGLPTPSISWTCHGRPVPLNSEGYWLQTNVLQIPSAVEKNEGWCCCIALNQVGNDTRCAYITVTSLPRVTVHDFRPVAIVGRDALINVEVIGDGKMTTYWTHNGVQLGGSSRHQQLLNNSLLIRNIKFSDAGRYQLTAANEFGSTRIDVELTVYEPPHVRNMRNRSVLVGSSIQMQCIANGRPSPTIAWYRHGRRITTGGRFLVAWPGILQISRTDTADAGEYTCTARNVAGVHSGSVHLSVLVPPSIVDSTRSLPPFRPGDTLEIPCVVSGNPKPLVTWTKNGIPISALGNSRVYVDQDNTLVIRQVQSSDSGSYMCSARSSVGTASRTVTFSSGDPVTVTSPIPPVAISFPTIIRPSTSTSVLTVTCVVQGLTNYNVVWTRNGNALPSDPRYSIRSTASGSVLTISNAGPQDMGAYGCSATGTQVVGSGTQIIVGQPRISSTQTNIYSETPGRSIQLSCPVTGHPTPTITWLKNNAPLTIDGSKYIASGTTLTIRNLQSSDAGYYSCQAANIHGTATHTVVVLVTAANPPSNRRVYDVYIGATVRLSCTLSVNGVPSTNVLWRLNGIPLLSGNRIAINPSGTLTITGVTLSDQGIYTCYDDRLGAALSLDSELRVQSQPWQQGGSWQVRPEDGGWRVGPAPLDNPNSVPVNAGGNVLLPCQLPPVITWYKDGRSILLDNRISLLSNGYLRINRLKLSDSGSYECRSSSRTSEKHTVVLDVKAIANVQPTEPVQPATAAVTEQATVVVTGTVTKDDLR